MTSTQLFAFVILPITIAALGWGAVLLNEWLGRRDNNRRHTPAE